MVQQWFLRIWVVRDLYVAEKRRTRAARIDQRHFDVQLVRSEERKGA
jgi:hypothetical protein